MKKGTKVTWGKTYENGEVGILQCNVEGDSALAWHHVGFPVMTSYGMRYAHWVEKFKELEKDTNEVPTI